MLGLLWFNNLARYWIYQPPPPLLRYSSLAGPAKFEIARFLKPFRWILHTLEAVIKYVDCRGINPTSSWDGWASQTMRWLAPRNISAAVKCVSLGAKVISSGHYWMFVCSCITFVSHVALDCCVGPTLFRHNWQLCRCRTELNPTIIHARSRSHSSPFLSTLHSRCAVYEPRGRPTWRSSQRTDPAATDSSPTLSHKCLQQICPNRRFFYIGFCVQYLIAPNVWTHFISKMSYFTLSLFHLKQHNNNLLRNFPSKIKVYRRLNSRT